MQPLKDSKANSYTAVSYLCVMTLRGRGKKKDEREDDRELPRHETFHPTTNVEQLLPRIRPQMQYIFLVAATTKFCSRSITYKRACKAGGAH